MIGNQPQIRKIESEIRETETLLKSIRADIKKYQNVKCYADKLVDSIIDFINKAAESLVKVVFLSDGKLIIRDNRIYPAVKMSPLPFDFENGKDIANDQLSTIYECVKEISVNGIDDATLKKLSVSLITVYDIFDRIESIENQYLKDHNVLELKRKEEKEKKHLSTLEADLESAKVSFNRLKNEIVLNQLDISSVTPNEFVLPLGLDEKDYGVFNWFASKGPLVIKDIHKDDFVFPLIVNVTLSFLLHCPNANARFLYTSINPNIDVTNYFSENLNKIFGKRNSFLNPSSLNEIDPKSEISSIVASGLSELNRRMNLCKPKNCDSILEFNQKFPENAQPLVLYIANEFSNSYESIKGLIEILKKGSKYGIYTIVIQKADEEMSRNNSSVKWSEFDHTDISFLESQSNESFTYDGTVFKGATIPEYSKIKSLMDKVSKQAPDPSKRIISYNDLAFNQKCPAVSGKEVKDIISIPVGMDDKNNVYNVSFSCKGPEKGAFTSLMITGGTGSGKSSLINSLILNGSMKYSPDDLVFYLIDFKNGNSIEPYLHEGKELPHIRIVSNEASASKPKIVLDLLRKKINDRNNIVKAASCNDIMDYNQKNSKHMPRILAIIDEANTMFETNPDSLIKSCEFILNQGRSVGVHLILAAQTITREMKSDIIPKITGRVAFENTDNNATETNLSSIRDSLRLMQERINGEKGTAVLVSSSNSSYDIVKFGFCNITNDSSLVFFGQIHSRWKNYLRLKTVVAGNADTIEFGKEYAKDKEAFKKNLESGIFIGYNFMDDSPVTFNVDGNSPTCTLLGVDKESIKNDCNTHILCSVMLYAAIKKKNVYVLDGSYSSLLYTFADLINKIKPYSIHSYEGRDYFEFLSDIKQEYQNHKSINQEDSYIIINNPAAFDAFYGDMVKDCSSNDIEGDIPGAVNLSAVTRKSESSDSKEPLYGRNTILSSTGLFAGCRRSSHYYMFLNIDSTDSLKDNTQELSKSKIKFFNPIVAADSHSVDAIDTNLYYKMELLKGEPSVGVLLDKSNISMDETMGSITKFKYFRYDDFSQEMINAVKELLK